MSRAAQVASPSPSRPGKTAIRESVGRLVLRQLRAHAPFTLAGTVTGVVLMLVILATGAPAWLSHKLFWTLHPLHVVLSAAVTTAMYELHGRRSLARLVVIGYVGAVGIATLSDSIMPFVGEWLLDLPNRGVHIGFVEKWWLVNPLALGGIALARFWPHTRVPHAGHVLLSTWASLFHMTMALGGSVGAGTILLSALFLFLAVWVPCCTSDIVFPLLFVERSGAPGEVAQDQASWEYHRPIARAGRAKRRP